MQLNNLDNETQEDSINNIKIFIDNNKDNDEL